MGYSDFIGENSWLSPMKSTLSKSVIRTFRYTLLACMFLRRRSTWAGFIGALGRTHVPAYFLRYSWHMGIVLWLPPLWRGPFTRIAGVWKPKVH